jgi:hypothetical protein
MPFFRQTAASVVLATLGLAMYDYVRIRDEIGVIGNFTLHAEDIVFVFTVMYCGARSLRPWRHSPLEYLNLLLCGVMVLNFARGTMAVGVAAAGAQFRWVAGYISASVFVFLMDRRIDIDWVLDKIVLLGWGVVLLSALRLALGWDAFLLAEDASNPWVEHRVLDAAAALMLGEAALIALYRIGALPVGPKRRSLGAVFVVFVAMLLISDERTAIAATLAGIGALVATFLRQRRRVVVAAGSIIVVSVGVAAYGAWIANGGDIAALLPEAVTRVTTALSSDDPAGDYAWRLTQWQQYIDLYWQAGLLDQIIGMPLALVQSIGARYDNEYFLSSAHSQYVQLLLNAGIVGVVLFVWMLVVAVTKGIVLLAHRTRSDSSSHRVGLAIAILVSHAVFSYAYFMPNEQGLLLAIALRIIATAPGLAHGPALSRWHPPGSPESRAGADAPVSVRTAASRAP